MTAEELGKKIWEAVSIAISLDLEGKRRNELWLYEQLRKFEEEIRKDEAERRGE